MAEMSDFKRARVGCVAVIGNKVVATGFSQHRTHPIQKYFNRYRDFNGQENVVAKRHAEIDMLISVSHRNIDLSRADIYIYRICKSRPRGMAFPCESCKKALESAGAHNIYFTTDTEYDFIKLNTTDQSKRKAV